MQWLPILAFLVVLTGCLQPSHFQTPCKPDGEAPFGHVVVTMPLEVGAGPDLVRTSGTCVGVLDGDSWIATARLDEQGTATLGLPKAGEFYVSWTYTTPNDRYCDWGASERIVVPGAPSNITLQVAKSCQ